MVKDKSSTFTNPFSQTLGEANFKTLQLTQRYHDLLTRATHVLKDNIRILESLSKEAEKQKTLENGGFVEQYELLEITIDDVMLELNSFINHLGLIRARLDRITEAVRS